MISVISNDLEFDRKTDTKIEEIEAKPGVSGDVVVSNFNNEEKFSNSGVVNEAAVSSIAPKSERSGELKVRVSSESDIYTTGDKMESRVFEVKKNKAGANQMEIQNSDYFEVENDGFDGGNDSFEDENDQTVNNVVRVDKHVELYKSLLSEFDDFVANEKMNVGTSRALSYGLEVGDMVWGKVKSHPWWPGHIFNESFASNPVRHSRTDGHVLVAFFGDSSYGWFDPAELIPFDPHFVEKSQQTNSRNFVKAVEEAMDEACRRRGLGLACKCRNPYNFRTTNVQGYFVVDVPDFEPGGIYSANQIKKARDGFLPVESLSFVKQLAAAPKGSEQKSIDFIKNKATVLAFRKAVFEEFDETYAQAFGVQPARHSHGRANALDQYAKQPPRAPLSGPLVIAEPLGGGRSSKKSMKVKDHSKKDRYLFKRRDEPGDSRTFQTSQAQAGSLAPSAIIEGSSALAAGDYVLQKRAPTPHTAVKFEQTGFISRDSTGSSGNLHGKEAIMVNQAHPCNDTSAIQAASLDSKSSQDMDEIKVRMGSAVVSGSMSSGGFDMLGKKVFPGPVDGTLQSSQLEAEGRVDIENESAKMSRPFERLQQSELSSSVRDEGGHSLDQIKDSEMRAHPSSIDAKRSVGVSHGKMKKPKVLKRPLGDVSSENSFVGEPKKKKKKKKFGIETSSDHQQKRLVAGKGEIGVGNLAKKSAQIGFAHREDFVVNHQKKDVGANTSVLNSVGTSPGVGIIEVGLPQLLSDLHALALNPFHGLERNSPATIRQCFLRFRSLVYQKSLVLSPPSETEPIEARSMKSSSSIGVPGEIVRDLPASKPVKHLARPDDPTKAGRKRLPSERQEENAAKRLKKINNVKSLTAEKKAQRTLDGQRVEGKEHVAVLPLKPVKPDSIKKLDPPAKAVNPTMLVMKFPPGTSLPSAAELKARFGRFGPLDQSGTRVFWKSSSCRVVFRYKVDAHAAFKYANGNNALFGNVKVRYSLRDFEASTNEVADSDKSRGDDATNETPRSKDPMVERSIAAFPCPAQATIQLKSCLKKPTGDEAGQVSGGNGSRGTARVKFMLGGEENSRGEQLMVGNRNNFNNNASFADGGAPSSVAMDFNSKNFQKVMPPFSSTMHSHAQVSKPVFNNSHHSEVAPRNTHVNTPSIPPSAPSIDISQQMLSLLTRCSDVVTNITGLLGYVPYHPI
ncbi:hypothetical protein JRO89_XS03G0331100 [Xanthoceras sorbifolium]|uniref:PWWP domain-containing protein n=1 Tax=Xanthoceras sorbifolium TaxID=99658 RepID=A0ABQ8IDX1_9ROSI|nr:hypothetical protein JRO89_XS03G0331100 [Xanthoceras sorbifolium]